MTDSPAPKTGLKAKQLYFGLVGLTAALILIALFMYASVQKHLSQKIRDLSRVSAQAVLVNQQIESLKQLQADYQQVKPLAAKVQKVLPAQKDQAEVVAQISTIVQRDQLNLSGLSFDTTQGVPNDKSQTQPTNVSGIFVMPVHFETIGSYHQIEAVLGDFETEQRFMRVSTLEITRTDTGDLDANFTLEVFFKP